MISIIINIKNGERRLESCLNSLVKFDEIILLDNYSTDNSIKIASKFKNIKIYQCVFDGMAKVRNKALNYATNDWVFFIDCDEILEPQLVETILNFKFKDKHIYSIYRKNYYNNLLINASSWGNDWVTRIFNKNDNSYDESFLVHESIANNCAAEKIKNGCILHFPYENVSQLIDKMQRYSCLYAQQYISKKKPKLYTIPLRTFFMFLKSYILKKGFMYGFEGLVISYFNSMGVFTKYIKLYENIYIKNMAIIINASDITINLIDQLNQQIYLPCQVFIFNNIINKNAIIPLLLEKLSISFYFLEQQDLYSINYKKDFNVDIVVVLKNYYKLNNTRLLKNIRNNLNYKILKEPNKIIFEY